MSYRRSNIRSLLVVSLVFIFQKLHFVIGEQLVPRRLVYHRRSSLSNNSVRDENEMSTTAFIHNYDHRHLRRGVLQADTAPQLVAKLTASNGDEENYFGDNNAVAISNQVDQTIVIGAPRHDYSRGAVYLYRPESGGYTEVAVLKSSDRYFSDNFGTSVAIDNDWIAVGADKHPNATGTVYIYRMMDSDTETGPTGATELAKITASDDADGNLFGASVAMDGPILVVGADGDADNGELSGAAYIYSHDSATNSNSWSEVTKLKPSDGGVEHLFGWSVAISGNTVVVGTYGANAAYVFRSSTTTSTESWSQVAKLTSGAASRYSTFGQTVAVSNNTIVVGAPGDNNENGVLSGSVFVYKIDQLGSWTEDAILIVEDGQIGEQFGFAAAISKDDATIVVGAMGNSEMGDFAGAAYFYRELDGEFGVGWTLVGKFVASDGAKDDRVGGAVAISGNIAVLGTDGDDIGTYVDAGSAYVLNLAPTTFSPTPAITTLEPTVMESPSTPTSGPTSFRDDLNQESTESSSGLQPSVIIAIAAVLGAVVTVVLGLFLFLNFRFKMQQQQLLLQQQNRQQVEEPQEPPIQPRLPPTSGNSNNRNPPVTESPGSASTEAAVTAQTVYPGSDVPTTIAAVAYVEDEAVIIPSLNTDNHVRSPERSLEYKDQVRNVISKSSSPPSPSSSQRGHPVPLHLPNRPRTHYEQEEDGKPRHRRADPPTR
jgi:hypothetical protein